MEEAVLQVALPLSQTAPRALSLPVSVGTAPTGRVHTGWTLVTCQSVLRHVSCVFERSTTCLPIILMVRVNVSP
eukprot:3633457-Rhodomonas_salina.2